MSTVRTLFRKTLATMGYQLGKYPSCNYATVPVFDLAIHHVMQQKGNALSFIQVGANDGVRGGDPLNKYINKGYWQGVLIEPQPAAFAKLQATYASSAARLILENVAISADGGCLRMYRKRSPKDAGDENSLLGSEFAASNPVLAARQLGVPERELESFDVPCVTLAHIVEKHGLRSVDVLQIDTEGHDFEVLRTFPFTRMRPSVIQFEHGHLPASTISTAVRLLSDNGYSILYGGRQCDTVAMHAECLPA